MLYYTHSAAEVLQEIQTTENGLTSSEAAARLKIYGENILEEKEKISPLRILIDQFNSPVVWILLAALAISFFIGEKVDAIVILAILIINAILGFIQEYNAAREIDALKKLSSLKALVYSGRKSKRDRFIRSRTGGHPDNKGRGQNSRRCEGYRSRAA